MTSYTHRRRHKSTGATARLLPALHLQPAPRLLPALGLLAALLAPSRVGAQDTEYYSKTVRELSGRRFEGRGYVKDGVRKAEAYLAEEYARAGADEVTLQPFTIDINTFPGRAKLSVDGKRLAPGDGFVMREYSPGVHGKFPLYYVDTLNFDFDRIVEDIARPEYSGCFVVCDFRYTYSHREEFKRLEEDAALGNAGLLLTWETPLKFYKAYGEKVHAKPTIWCGPDFPKSARTISADIDSEFRPGYLCNNVIARVSGERHDSTIVFLAHYDHLGHLGRRLYFPGTDDNASGTAALVTLARHFSANRPEFDLLFLSVAGEEANLRGSTFFAEHPTIPLESIKYLINLDMIGDDNPHQYCEVSDAGMAGYERFVRINAEGGCFASLDRGPLAANSDHYPFAIKGVPCIFFENESGSVFPFYHTCHDDFSRFVSSTWEKLYTLILGFVH